MISINIFSANALQREAGTALDNGGWEYSVDDVQDFLENSFNNYISNSEWNNNTEYFINFFNTLLGFTKEESTILYNHLSDFIGSGGIMVQELLELLDTDNDDDIDTNDGDIYTNNPDIIGA